EKLGGTTQHKTKPLSGTLQGVIEDTQNLLVVSVASLGVGELVQVHQLIETYRQSATAGQPNESREQLELIVDRRIVDDGSHTQCGAGICPGSELATQPADSIRLELLVALFEAFAISRDYISKVIAVDHLCQLLEMLTNHSLTVFAGRFGFRLGLCNELLDYSLQSTAIRFSPGGHILGQFGIQRASLAASSMETTIRVQIRKHGDELALHRNRANQVEEERLACAIFTDHYAERGTTFREALHITDERLQLTDTPHLNQVLAGTGNDAGAQGL